jgi:hypothetical protein
LCSKPAEPSATEATTYSSIRPQPMNFCGTSTCTKTDSTASCSPVMTVGTIHHQA